MPKYSVHCKENWPAQRVRRNNFCSTFVIKMYNILKSSIISVKAGTVVKLASFFVICFCSLFLLFVGLDRAQTTKGI